MKIELNEWQKKVLASWPMTFEEILKSDWEKVKDRYRDVTLGKDIPNDIRISLLALFGDQVDYIMQTKTLEDFIGENSIYELLMGTTRDRYSIEEGENLVRFYLANYWASKYR